MALARRIVAVTGFVGASACIFFFAGIADPVRAMIVLGFAGFFNDFVMPAAWAGTMDIGGRYSGTVSGAMNMMGSIAGAVVGHRGRLPARLDVGQLDADVLHLGGDLPRRRDLLAVPGFAHADRTTDRLAAWPRRRGSIRGAPSTTESALEPSEEVEFLAQKSVLDSFRLGRQGRARDGGARGLGQTMATALAQAGADVAITGADASACERRPTAIAEETGRRCRAFAADVTSVADVERLAAEVEAAFGQIDILVNNAGTNIRGQVDQLSEADWDTVIDTNLKGPFLCARAIGPRMVKRGWGRVINIGSTLSVIALPGRAPYASSKAGVLNLSRVLALEWAGTGVTVNTICPGRSRPR